MNPPNQIENLLKEKLPTELVEMVMDMTKLLTCKGCTTKYPFDTPGFPDGMCPGYCKGCKMHNKHSYDCKYCLVCKKVGYHDVGCTTVTSCWVCHKQGYHWYTCPWALLSYPI